MIYREKSRHYRQLAKRYLEEGVVDQAVACLAQALRLDPHEGRQDIEAMLQEAARHRLGDAPPAPTAETRRLDRRRQKRHLAFGN